jgi:hypothetical protein
MKKAETAHEVRKEYHLEELGRGTRGKHYKDYMKGSKLVLLSPDVAAAFPDDESVDVALRGLMDLAKRTKRPACRSSRRTGTRG